MAAKSKKATKSPTTKAKVDKKVAKEKASFKVVETKPAEEVVKTEEQEVVEEKEAPKTEPVEETPAEQKPTEEPLPAEVGDKTEEAKTETDSKIPSITSFSQLDSQNSAPANSDSLSEEKVEEVKKDEKVAESNEKLELEKTSSAENEKGEKDLSSEDVKKWLKDVRPDTTKEVEKGRKSGLKIVLIVVVILAILGVIAGGIFYYQTGFDKETDTTSDEQEQEEAPVATEAPEPTPEEVDLSELSVNILNGSGIAGEAGKVDALLTDLSFASTETGNADSYDYTTTIVGLKKEVSNQVYDKIKDALSENYMVEKSDDVLEDGLEYDVKIIVGSQKAE